MNIPKIIHQIWIGNKPPPINLMNTWKEKNPDYEYILWNENEFIKRKFNITLKDKVNKMEELCGKADILRYEILYKYGGIYLDADSICIEPLGDRFKNMKGFACYENEKVRNKGWNNGNKEYEDVLASTHPLLANGNIGFVKEHQILKEMMDWIKTNDITISKTKKRAWRNTGPGLLTRIYYSKIWKDISILPSYMFLPIHLTGMKYKGHGKVYAHQEWGSTKLSYDKMNSVILPEDFNIPKRSVSVLIPCYNINASYFKQTLDSIINQVGFFFINLVCINDGSNDLNTKILVRLLKKFEQNSRWIKVHYHNNEKNIGIGPTLRKGVILCPDEIILRMDSDDIMHTQRIMKQIDFMDKNKDCPLCGSQILLFKNNLNHIQGKTSHPNYEWKDYIKMKVKPHWLMNHPTFCFRKSKILEVGNYESNIKSMYEDFYLILKVMKKYGKIYNMKEALLFYRLHENQLTHNGGREGRSYWNKIRNNAIEKLINS